VADVEGIDVLVTVAIARVLVFVGSEEAGALVAAVTLAFGLAPGVGDVELQTMAEALLPVDLEAVIPGIGAGIQPADATDTPYGAAWAVDDELIGTALLRRGG